MNFVFAHIDMTAARSEVEILAGRYLAKHLVESILRFHPDACITQLSDPSTSRVHQKVNLCQLDVPVDKPNLARMYLYAAYTSLSSPTVYLDADMLLLRPFNLDIPKMNDRTVVLCKRSFTVGTIVSLDVPVMNKRYDKFIGQNIEDVMPYLACFAITASNAFWVQVLVHMHRLQPDLQAWFGDQIAMKQAAASPIFDVRLISESRCAWPTNHINDQSKKELSPFVHLKGTEKDPSRLKRALERLSALSD